MKKILLVILSIVIISGCKREMEGLPSEEIAREKDAVIKVCTEYNKASEVKSWSRMVLTLADEVIFFGTDSSEIIRTFPDFKKKMLEQWEEYESIKYGDMVDVSIQMDKQATLASIIFGMPVFLTKNGTTVHYFLRGSRTLKKEKESWVIVSGIVGIARSGEAQVIPPHEGDPEKKD
jgi:hypothetical protein